MLKFLGNVLLLLVMCAVAAEVRAEINAEPFLPEAGYAAGTPLSAFYFDALKDGNGDTIDTTGVLDMEDVGPDHNLVVRFSADGSTSSFPRVSAQAGDVDGGGWGGPVRQGTGPSDDTRLWFAVDIEKGTPDASTPTGAFIWTLSFTRPNGQNIFTLDGGLGTFRLKTQNSTNNTGSLTLGQRWNQLVVLNDLNATPNTVVYLNGIQVAALQATDGALTSGTTNTGSVNLTRLARGGPGDHFVGTMRFDNIITANEDIIKFLAGDVNHDGIVDVSDIQEIAAHYLTTGPDGDANNDGFVDVSDIQVIAANYLNGGGGLPPGPATAVPEPGTAAMMVLGLSLGMVRIRARRHRVAK